MISTVSDLLVYGRHVATGNGLVSEPQQLDRRTSFPGEAGYGLAMGCSAGWVRHTGELPGCDTSMFYDTEEDVTVMTMTNSDIPSCGYEASETLHDDHPFVQPPAH